MSNHTNEQNNRMHFWVQGIPRIGKTTFVKNFFKPDLYLDLNEVLLYRNFVTQPVTIKNLISENILTIAIDHIEVVPQIIPVIHQIIHSPSNNVQFILISDSTYFIDKCESEYKFHFEVFDFNDILKFFSSQNKNNKSLLSSHLVFGSILTLNLNSSLDIYIQELSSHFVKNYIFKYFTPQKPELFFLFLEKLTYFNGQIANFEKLSEQTKIPSRTVREYFHVLIQLQLVELVYSLNEKNKPIFYFVDIGLVYIFNPQLTSQTWFQTNLNQYQTHLTKHKQLENQNNNSRDLGAIDDFKQLPINRQGRFDLSYHVDVDFNLFEMGKTYFFQKLRQIKKTLNIDTSHICYLQNYKNNKIDFIINGFAFVLVYSKHININHFANIKSFQKNSELNKFFIIYFSENVICETSESTWLKENNVELISIYNNNRLEEIFFE